MSTTITRFEEQVAEFLNQLTSGIADPEDWLIEALGGSGSSSGVRVNATTVLSSPTAWWSIDRISGDIGKLPLEVRRRQSAGGSVLQSNGPLVELHNLPNFYQVGSGFRVNLQVHALIHGNGRAFIERNAAGVPIELVPILPGAITTQLWQGNKLHHFTFNPQQFGDRYGGNAGREFWIDDRDILHIKGLSYDGVNGVPLVNIAADVFGIDKSSRDALGNTMRNNGRPDLVLEVPQGQLRSAKERREVLEQWNEAHGGTVNAGKTAMLHNGMKLQVVNRETTGSGGNAETSDALVKQIAMLFNTEMLLQSNAVYKDLSERLSAYATNCLGKWFQAWQDECDNKLLTTGQRQRGLFHWFNRGEILASDPNARANYTSSLRQQGILSGDEARMMHNLNPVGLDDYGNPNVSSGNETSDDEAEETEEEETAARNAIKQQLRFLLQTEKRRIRDAVKGNSATEFRDKVGQFLEKHMRAVGNLAAGLEMPDALISGYHVDRVNQIWNETAGINDGQLPARVDAMLSDWDTKFEETFQC